MALFLLEMQAFRPSCRSLCGCIEFRQSPEILSEIFVLYVLSRATEVVMFTNRSNYPSDVSQRQLAIFQAKKTRRRQGIWNKTNGNNFGHAPCMPQDKQVRIASWWQRQEKTCVSMAIAFGIR
ncbi:hypothetical protein [Rhizobium sp. SYY.PMSO]|uniref:hypothetical protein n=1 Tax=Rhizobium sp. SYY.PMSO TaxID=3382192 RepID=UPI00398FF09D